MSSLLATNSSQSTKTSKSRLDKTTQEELSNRQKSILFAVVKEYCDHNHTLGSVELKEKYNFTFSSATIRNELVVLREKGYLYQPFTNASSKPTEKSFKMFINQLMIGLQVTSKQQNELKKQIQAMEAKHANLSKEISRLLALTSGGVGFSLTEHNETFTGVGNLLTTQGDGKVSDILNFLDNLDTHKKHLLTSREVRSEMQHELENELGRKFKTIIGGEHPVIPLGKGYAMVATEVFLEKGKKSVIGVISPIHLLANEQNLSMIENLSDLFGVDSKTKK
jgi:transcriptional regulator of heat shock response